MKKRIDKPPKGKVVIRPEEIQRTIKIPKLEYKVVEQPTLKTAFTGSVMVIPTVLLFYLKPTELKVVAVIIRETMEKAACKLDLDQFAVRTNMVKGSVRLAIKCLNKMNIISQKRDGRAYIRELRFDNIQRLDKLLEDENKAVSSRLRKFVKNKSLTKITKDDVARCYTNTLLPPDDLEENEEYD